MNGTVDIGLPLTSKANDQVEFSAGWGQTGIIGKLSLKFTNFSVANLLPPNPPRSLRSAQSVPWLTPVSWSSPAVAVESRLPARATT